MKRHRRIISLFLMIFIFLSFTACEKPMSEEEIKEACMAEAENFVGGYLSNTNLDYLDKYIVYSVKRPAIGDSGQFGKQRSCRFTGDKFLQLSIIGMITA